MADKYEAVIMLVAFDDKYNFEDVQLVGIAHNKVEANYLLFEDIERIMKDFGGDRCEIVNTRSNYDEPVIVVHTYDKENKLANHWHYYCLFNEEKKEENDT